MMSFGPTHAMARGNNAEIKRKTMSEGDDRPARLPDNAQHDGDIAERERRSCQLLSKFRGEGIVLFFVLDPANRL